MNQKQIIFFITFMIFSLPSLLALEKGLIITDTGVIENRYLEVRFADTGPSLLNKEIVVFYAINNDISENRTIQDASKIMYDLDLIKQNLSSSRSQFFNSFQIDQKYSNNYGVFYFNLTEDNESYIILDLNCSVCSQQEGFSAISNIASDVNITIFIARYDLGKTIFNRENKASLVDKSNFSSNQEKYTKDIFGNRYLKKQFMFDSENLETTKSIFEFRLEVTDLQSDIIFPLPNTSNEGDLDINLENQQIPESIETDEFSNIFSNFSENELNNSFVLNSQINYKYLNISSYSLAHNRNIRKRIYVYNQGRTHVINNSLEEIRQDKLVDLNLILSSTTKEIYVAIDRAQSPILPNMNLFVLSNNPTIELLNSSPRYLKFNRPSLTNNKLILNIKPNIENISIQIIELDVHQKVTGIYSTNLLQMDYNNFNKYALFQINKNIIEFYCPYCRLKDYGLNENSFSACGKSIFEKDKKSITEHLKAKENVCLLPDGSRISGFTNEALQIFGLDRMYFEWDDLKITSDLFDYGEYYIDQDQFRIAISKKLDNINSNNVIQLGDIKYKKARNNLISKVGTYIEHDLNEYTANSSNASIDDSFNHSIAVLNQIPREYQKLTILDLVNNEPEVSEQEFQRIMQEILVNPTEYYKYTDYHTHYQITVEKYISSINYFKIPRSTNDIYSKLLFSLENKTRGYSNIYFSESLNYFIYNLKPFLDITGETKHILKNQYNRFLRNYWELTLTNTEDIISPKTVVVNIEEININWRNAIIKLEEPSTPLYLSYLESNRYYSYNPLFYKSINPISYNFNSDFLSQTDSIKSKNINQIDTTNDLQNGKLFVLNSNISINYTSPVIITKEQDTEITIKNYNGKEYVPIDLQNISVIYIEDQTRDTLIIYPPKPIFRDYPLIIESTNLLLFNLEHLNYSVVDNLYLYKIIVPEINFNLSELINGISNREFCFLVSQDSFSVWKNIAVELDSIKSIAYNEFNKVINESNSLSNQLTQNTGSQVNTSLAIYTENGNELYEKMNLVNTQLQNQIEIRNLDVFRNYGLAYKELLKAEPNLNKEFIDLFNCNESLICQVSKTAQTPNGGFYSRFNTTCVPNTPTNCVSYWSNPRVNSCSAFIKNFNNYFFGYRFDSANAWDLAMQPNNKSIWKTTVGTLNKSYYDSLVPGSILGIKHNNTSYWNKEYSHVVVYLGKIGSNHYIIHSWGSTLKIEKLDVFLKTTARGKNACGYYEDGQIKEVIISNNLYQKLRAKARERSIYFGSMEVNNTILPDYILDYYNSFELASSTQRTVLNDNMYGELNEVYDRILQKEFNIYYKTNYTNSMSEINERIRLVSQDPMIIILGKYKRIFLVKKLNNQTQIISEYPISTGVNGFGCETGSLKTPLGLFRVIQKSGQNAVPLQVIGANGPETNNGFPVFASLNSGTAKIVTRKLVLDGLEKENLGVGCDSGNRNTIYRGTYIHGTNYENSMGQQKSHGCIRMLNNDIINLFNNVQNGTYVYIYNSKTSYSQLLDLQEKNTEQFVLGKLPNVMTLKTKRSQNNQQRSPQQKAPLQVIASLKTGTDNCYTTNAESLRKLSSGNLNLATARNIRRNLDSVIVLSTPSLSYQDIIKISQPIPNRYRAHEKFTTAIPTLYNLCAIYGVDPIFVLAKFKNEKSMYNVLSGNYKNGALVLNNNPTGIKSYAGCACGGYKVRNSDFCTYPTLHAGFEATLVNLVRTKHYKGLTVREVARTWAEDPNYHTKLLDNFNEFYNKVR